MSEELPEPVFTSASASAPAPVPAPAEVIFRDVSTPAAREAAKAHRAAPMMSPAEKAAIEAENDAMAERRAEILDSHINGAYKQRQLKVFSSFYEYEVYEVSDSDENAEDINAESDAGSPGQPVSVPVSVVVPVPAGDKILNVWGPVP